jgi:uncharacterized protein YacL
MKKKLIIVAFWVSSLVAGYFIGRLIAKEGIEFDTDINTTVLLIVISSAVLFNVVFWIHSYWDKKKNPEKLKQLEIDGKDERNIRVGEKAASISWIITYVMLAFITLILFLFTFGLARWLFLSVLIIHFASFIILRKIYDKEM